MQTFFKSLHTSIPGFQPFSNGRRHGRITNDIAGKLTRVLRTPSSLPGEAYLGADTRMAQSASYQSN
jgi:hypothetical protein